MQKRMRGNMLKLAPHDREWLHAALSEGWEHMSYREIAEQLRMMGYAASKSGVGRYYQSARRHGLLFEMRNSM